MTPYARSWATTPGRPASARSTASSDGCCARSPPGWRRVSCHHRSRSTRAMSSEWSGRAHYFFEAADRTAAPGVATGLAVTGTGGDVLFVEASVMAAPRGSPSPGNSATS